MKTQEDLLNILRNGGGIDIQVRTRSKEDLLQLVRNQSQKSPIVLRGLDNMNTDDIVQISRNCAGAVTFVFE